MKVTAMREQHGEPQKRVEGVGWLPVSATVAPEPCEPSSTSRERYFDEPEFPLRLVPCPSCSYEICVGLLERPDCPKCEWVEQPAARPEPAPPPPEPAAPRAPDRPRPDAQARQAKPKPRVSKKREEQPDHPWFQPVNRSPNKTSNHVTPGKASKQGDYKRGSPTQDKVLDALKGQGALSTSDVAERAGLNKNQALGALSSLRSKRMVERIPAATGKYLFRLV